ncbi:hypothetical protein RKD38_002177 [Streptomyces ambofaciens]
MLVVVDQPASTGALPLAVARDAGCRVAYLPGLTMRRIADLYPGESKTDARDAAVIADAARTMPHTLRDLAPDDETVAEPNMIVGFDDDLADEVTRTKNRLRGLLTQIHPSLERVLGSRLDHPAVLFLLEHHGSPAQLRKAGRRRLISMRGPRRRAWQNGSSQTSSTRSMNRPSSCPAPTLRRRSSPAWLPRSPPYSTSADSSPPGSRNSWRHTPFPKS